jgi:hypothetical protein
MVHPTYSLFLAVYLAHLLADFVFQTDRIVFAKHLGAGKGYFLHALTHYLSVIGIVALVDPHRFLTLSFQLIAIVLSVVHLFVDWAKVSLTKAGRLPDNAVGFLLDQLVHLLTVLAAVLFLVHPPSPAWDSWLIRARSSQEKILLALVVYVFVIFAGGYLIRELIRPLWKQDPGQPSENHDEVVNAGLYIGWLERLLILTALVLQSPGTVGFILAAKSIARYPELKSIRFAEYFLIGTLISVTMAVGGAVLLLWAFYGTVSLAK